MTIELESFELAEGVEILSRTPGVLRELLTGLSEAWTTADEGPKTWSPFDVVGHLIHGERTDWIPRARIILEQGEIRPFDPFDRFAQLEENRGKSLGDLLDELARLRRRNLEALAALDLDDEKLARTGIHPELGLVTLKQLLATWVTHDLGHIAQISRVMAKRYAGEVGPWEKYIPVLSDRTRG